jgi:hypothetical protein
VKRPVPPTQSRPELGALRALQIVDSLAALVGTNTKWAVVVTWSRDNEKAMFLVRRLIEAKLNVTRLQPPDPNDLDAPRFPIPASEGVTLHGDNKLNERLFAELGVCFGVKRTSQTIVGLEQWYKLEHDRTVDWIETGPGSVWKSPVNRGCLE